MRVIPFPAFLRLANHFCSSAFGWYPLIFFTTLYISDVYRDSLSTHSLQITESSLTIDEEGTRQSYKALLYSSILWLAAMIFFFFLAKKNKTPSNEEEEEQIELCEEGGREMGPVLNGSQEQTAGPMLAMLWCYGQISFTLCMAGTLLVQSVEGAILMITLTGVCAATGQWASTTLVSNFDLLEGVLVTTCIAGRGNPTRKEGV